MSNYDKKPKPDNRSDNADKLHNMIHDTLENIDKAEDTMEFSEELDQMEIAAKNKRRKKAVEGFKEELKDEQHNQEK